MLIDFFFDNPTRKFLTNQIAAPGRVKKQWAVFQRKNLCQNETSNLLCQLDNNFQVEYNSWSNFFQQNLSFKT
jgi:hypothetical protein